MTDWDSFRRQFPALETYTYLNTAGGGPVCRRAAAAGAAYFHDLETSGDVNWPRWLDAVEVCRARVARLLNARPEQIAFVQNVSLALNHVAQITAAAQTRVAMPAGEFPSVSLPWLNRGCEIETFKFGTDGRPIALDTLGPVDWLVASLVQYRSGVVLDIEDYAGLKTPAGGRPGLVFDATQAFGVRPMDVTALKADALGFSVYKWVGAGYGVGILYLRDGFLEEYGYPAVGWRSSDDPYSLIADRLTTTGHARDLELGHPPIPAVLALGPALELLEDTGIERIAARVQELTDTLLRGLAPLPVEIVSPADPARRSGITVIRTDRAAQLASQLKARNILVSQFDDRLRISCHAYTNERDIGLLLDGLKSGL